MSKKTHWRHPNTYLHAVRSLGRRAAGAAGYRDKKRPRAPQPVATPLPPYGATASAGPTLNKAPFTTRRVIVWFVLLVLLALLVIVGQLAWHEMRTSQWQAKYFAEWAGRMGFALQPGPTPAAAVRYPADGPYDQRMGYSNMPDYLGRLQAKDFQISAQARMTPAMVDSIDEGLFAPYREKTQQGLSVYDCRKQPLFAVQYPERSYPSFAQTPALLVKSLLFIENRELLDPRYPLRNPAVEWSRLGRALFEHVGQVFGADGRTPGGSTLATQIEKYRHSPDGRTASLHDKLRQMASATVRAYQPGQDTTAARQQLVLDYLNTVPLSARPGFGEVNGMGDGLWVWYGRDFEQATALLHAAAAAAQPTAEQALAYKQALSLVIAQRRPSYYLADPQSDLEDLTDSHLRLLASQEVISDALRDAALAVKLGDRSQAPVPAPAPSFVSRKASTAIRSQLLGLLGVPNFYSLDRLDLGAVSTLDGQTQEAVTTVLRQLRDAEVAKAAGLTGKGLLGNGDPAQVVYSFTLLERGEDTNYLRLQTDNYDQPLDINAGAKLDLGSTAKLRTLVTYLDIMAGLHQRYSAMDAAARGQVVLDPKDKLSRWVLDYLGQNPSADLPTLLQAALDRKYSANPDESFYTGGGLHTFNNFKREDNNRIVTVREGLRHSVNLVFVRLLRDVVHHYMFQVPGSSATLLQDGKDPRRADYLSRFADREGKEFINRFVAKYQGKTAEQAQELLLHNVRPTPVRLSSIFRTIAPTATQAQLGAFLKENLPEGREVTAERLAVLYTQYGPEKMSLADRGYSASVHPLELWVVAYLRANPGATQAQMVAASAAERQVVYQWLFASKLKPAQDKRILSLLEVEGFLEIHRQWKRMGYPFGSLVPSYATALGASADRPAALAELMGIIVNGGLRKPTQRIAALHFASSTPYEAVLQHHSGASEQVLAPEVAQAALGAVRDVVDEGTARRVKNVFKRVDGTVMAVGGKTGTGDHRYETFGGQGQLLDSRVVSRSATFVFNIGERFFGSITAYVYGPQAADYDFTSALPVQLLKVLSPTLMPLMDPAGYPSAAAQPCSNWAGVAPPAP
ncbi:penicillin-binding protein [Rhodoferax sp. AJA081-3]|uniref:transglycosylase domain-containing protein n=1 Tax=Rhodoferax sp. AJA081-3 TaxID=2752316 RepID=UPI001AE00E21|nr:transglycosylase domain-containing protein [Rhodoferax sp. AJA081-3]QTN29059.1 penicillin-binding protein [Rhodoferax sp. AJA081-3]